MFIKVNENDLKKIKNLLKIKEYNIYEAEAFYSFSFDSEGILPKNHEEYLSILKEYLDIQDKKEDQYFFDEFISSSIKPYTAPICEFPKIPEAKLQGYEIKYLSIKPYQCFPYDDILINGGNYQETSQIGYLEKEYRYPSIMKDDVVWMSTDINEINTMKPAIEMAKGHILMFGLGLGYLPFMCSNKKEVSSITVVEYDANIISLFKENILPYFPNKEKINVVSADAFDYLKRNDVNKKFDYVFYDIWHDASDGLPLYLLFKKLEPKGVKNWYWLEESIIAMLRRCLLTVIEEALQHTPYKNYLKAKNDYDKIINALYFASKDQVLTSYEQVHALLSKESLLKIIKRIN